MLNIFITFAPDERHKSRTYRDMDSDFQFRGPHYSDVYMSSIFKANAIVKKMAKANQYTYQRLLRFLDGSGSDLTDVEKLQLRRVIKKETDQLFERL